MSNEELLEELNNMYLNTIDGITTQEELIRAKAHREVVEFITMRLTQPKKRSK